MAYFDIKNDFLLGIQEFVPVSLLNPNPNYDFKWDLARKKIFF